MWKSSKNICSGGDNVSELNKIMQTIYMSNPMW